MHLTPEVAPAQRIALLILAHNEAGIIGETSAALIQELEPGDDLFVVADHCRDATADIARQAGARVLEPSFTRIVKSHLSTGQQAIQAFLQPVCSQPSPVGRLAALSELLDQCLSDRLRSMLHWPVRLRGTGMIISPGLLEGVFGRIATEVEDIALTLLLAAEGIYPSRLPEAVVFDQKPGSSRAAAEQRARWYHGQWTAAWHYRKEIIRLLLRGPAGWSLLSSLFLRPKWLVVAVELLLGIALLGIPWLSSAFLLLGSLSLLYYLCGLTLIPEPRPYLRALLHLPAFIWMWLRSLVLAFRTTSWRRSRN
jgi:cellulose synthase/poly-beta-1,6-N-acetylglucosamine synthase-like glycosyltransferase